MSSLDRPPRVWLLNLDAEHELATAGRYTRSRALGELVARQRRRLVGGGRAVARVAQARDASSSFRGFLVWSRFPFWTLEQTTAGTRVAVGDMRFVGRGRPFVQTVTVP